MLLFLVILAAAGAIGLYFTLRLMNPAQPGNNPAAESQAAGTDTDLPEEEDSKEENTSPEPSAQSDQAEIDAQQQAEADKWKQDSFASEAEDADPDEVVNDMDIPEEIRAFVAKYPEAAEFAANYAEYAEQHLPIDITTDVSEGGLPMFLQWDPRWGYETYGGGFMGVRGCGPTCLSMVLSGLTGHTEWNPLRTAQYAEENGYYLENVGTEWGLMQKGAVDLGLTVAEVARTEQGIVDTLRAGDPIICAMGPGDFTYSGHFIVLCSADESGAITIHDPNSRINSERTWTAAELIPQIKILWSYRVEIPEEETPPEETAPEETSQGSAG